MIKSLNYFINLLNLFLIFIYFIFINTNLEKKDFKFLLISLIVVSFFLKLFCWQYFNFVKKKNLNLIINSILFNDDFIKLCILIFSIATPIYMIFQKDSLIISLFVEKLSFLLLFVFSFLGFYLEFFILDSESNK